MSKLPKILPQKTEENTAKKSSPNNPLSNFSSKLGDRQKAILAAVLATITALFVLIVLSYLNYLLLSTRIR